ncbi:LTA synthase family protein [Pseudomonas sp. N040]|uniref:LTA synthase family protein n=1 Tax=Pseudomonas sp. N040 TaxID=2785325 RepID=UPI0018A2E086|nr:LTA synthase family protein [Pseudomonas sp. N040]MBF7730367.1 LTA synthase family protein [Pseudomonas sp. N040]MBW7014009.1 LTA synthase family protein [Pseudomonas sp. N040]
MPLFRSAPVRYLLLLLGSWLGIFLLTRGVLLLKDWTSSEPDPVGLLGLFASGLTYDLGFLAYAALPLGCCLLLLPASGWRRSSFRLGLELLLLVSLCVMLFSALAEWLFWDEFSVRFNFIAVDYLVYSDEVLNNILESYPVYALLSAIVCLALALLWLLHAPLQAALASSLPDWRGRVAGLLGLLLAATASNLLLDQQYPRGLDGNTIRRELASNGPYQFFAAFRNNELDYQQFFASLPAASIGPGIRSELQGPRARFTGSDPLDIRRLIDNPGQPRQLNIVLVTIESLSAKYLGSVGDRRGLTPNLDRLRRESLYFSNFYATGTRTDRGLEALTLSVPPTPGRSIVKRIGHESGFASLGQQLAARGYDSVFAYGGRGYFDNMNAFFAGNGYRIVDQSSVPEQQISFKNAWGMADEDLYRQAINLADSDYARGKPFLLQLMTTSNHRPYTYPQGRIDIPSGDGREGAVKYTDHAIGQFLAEARRKPWFDKTIFVFVADHCAGSAGTQDLPVANYQIPLFIYAPGLIAATDDQQLASQIDLAPTLLGLLNIDYQSTFFGRDLLDPQTRQLPARALLGNYQHLGLFDGENLAILSPQKRMRRHNAALGASQEQRLRSADPLLRRDIGYYQSASHALHNQLLAWQPLPDARASATGLR